MKLKYLSYFAEDPGLRVRGMNASSATKDSAEKLRASAFAQGAMADTSARRASSVMLAIAVTLLSLAVSPVLAQVNVASGGNWESTGTWSAGVPGGSHDVVIPAGVTVTNNGLGPYSINSLTITGTLTHTTNVATEVNKINLSIAGSLTIASGGAINVTSNGYATGQGPGTTVGRGGASHGGLGSDGGADSPPATASLVTYGSVTNPVNLGSGNYGRGAGQGGAGGGAVILVVVGAVTNNGTIAADGIQKLGDNGAGAGGSVNITANAFAGSGTISARGGTPSSNGGAGGGGRIALIAGSGTASQFQTLNITAAGGVNGGYVASAGTIYLRAPGQTYGSLVVRNAGSYSSKQTIWTNVSYHFDSIITTNYGTLAVGTNSVLDFTGTTLVSDSTPASITSRIIVDSTTTNRYVFPGPFTNGGCLSQSGTNILSFPGDVIIPTNGVLTHEGGLFSTTTEANRLNLTIAGNLTVNLGGAISVKGRGYGAAGGFGYGPGGSPGRAGASHGGQGASCDYTASTVTYGSIINPVNYGSGGGGRDGGTNPSMGGGAIILQVGGTVTVNGLINADGNYVGDHSAAAGGSVNITAASFAGTNTISAKGGPGNTNGAGAGGGRIALKAGSGDSTQFNTLTITAAGGGTGNVGLQDPAAGTIYLEAGSQGLGKGTVWINNGGAPSPAYTNTCIPPFTNAVLDELKRAMVVLTNYARVLAPTNTVIGDLLIYTNCTWTLNTSTVSVYTLEHSLADLTVKGPGATNRVDHYDQVLWIGPRAGMVITVR